MNRLLSNFKMPQFGRSPRLVGVDFDSRKLRIVAAERSSRGRRIVACGGGDLPAGLDVADASAVGALLGKALAEMGLRGAPLVMCVPRSLAVLKPVKLPPNTPSEDLAAMVHFQVAKELPFPPEDAVIDFTAESHYDVQGGDAEEQPGVNVLAAAVRLSAVDYYRRVAAAAEAKLLGLALRPYADLRCVAECEPQDAGACVVLVHMTADETEIDVVADGALAFSRAAIRSLPAGGDGAEVGPLVQEIARSLQSYHTVRRGARVDAVLVAGDTGLEDAACQQLAHRLAVPCRVLQCGSMLPGEAREASGYISALGLAACDAGELPFDFLNPKRPPVLRDKRKTRIQAAALAAILLLLVTIAGGTLYLKDKEARVAALQKADAALDAQIKNVREVARQVEAIEQWRDGDRKWLDHLSRLAALMPPAKDIYVTGLDAKADGSVSFVVQARGSENVTALGERLSGAGYSFRPGQIKTGNNKHGYPYGTTVRVMTTTELAATADAPAAAPSQPPDADEPADIQPPAAEAPPAADAPASETQPQAETTTAPPAPEAAEAAEAPPRREDSPGSDDDRRERPRRRAWRGRGESRRGDNAPMADSDQPPAADPQEAPQQNVEQGDAPQDEPPAEQPQEEQQ